MKVVYNSIEYNLIDNETIWTFAGDVCTDISDDDARRAYSSIYRDMRRAGMTSADACEDIRMEALREDLAYILRDALKSCRDTDTIDCNFHGVHFSMTV